MNIKNDGTMNYCRWANDFSRSRKIDQQSPIKFFQEDMSGIRKKMLDGEQISSCGACRTMEKHGKISGRQRQLLRAGIKLDNFEKTMLSSPMFRYFNQSYEQEGKTNLSPIDWQIDLGNHCNSACVYCNPVSSSKLASEFMKLGLINELPKSSWVENEQILSSLIEDLDNNDELSFIQFLGGETLITPAFRRILRELDNKGVGQRASIGFTTNLTVWDDEIIDLLRGFHSVNLGMSVDCLHPVNDYIRYPSKINEVEKNLEKWIQEGRKNDWFLQLRITPNALNVLYIDTIYQYAFDHEVPIESCNFLFDPPFMKISLLDQPMRELAMDRLGKWIESHGGMRDPEIVNTRNMTMAKQQVVEDASSYLRYLKYEPEETHLMPDLIEYINKLEKNRNNSILEYAPEYEKFLRSFGY